MVKAAAYQDFLQPFQSFRSSADGGLPVLGPVTMSASAIPLSTISSADSRMGRSTSGAACLTWTSAKTPTPSAPNIRLYLISSAAIPSMNTLVGDVGLGQHVDSYPPPTVCIGEGE